MNKNNWGIIAIEDQLQDLHHRGLKEQTAALERTSDGQHALRNSSAKLMPRTFDQEDCEAWYASPRYAISQQSQNVRCRRKVLVRSFVSRQTREWETGTPATVILYDQVVFGLAIHLAPSVLSTSQRCTLPLMSHVLMGKAPHFDCVTHSDNFSLSVSVSLCLCPSLCLSVTILSRARAVLVVRSWAHSRGETGEARLSAASCCGWRPQQHGQA